MCFPGLICVCNVGVCRCFCMPACGHVYGSGGILVHVCVHTCLCVLVHVGACIHRDVSTQGMLCGFLCVAHAHKIEL